MSAIRGEGIREGMKAHLRGARDIVRRLGSDADRRRLAEGLLPPIPEEFDRAVGRTFRLVDGMMSAAEVITSPLRARMEAAGGPSASWSAGEHRLAGRLERLLLSIAEAEGELQPPLQAASILRVSRLALRGLPPEKPVAADAALAARVFLALNDGSLAPSKASPADRRALRAHAAAALMLQAGIAADGTPAGMRELAEDALLLAGARLEVFEAAAGRATATAELVQTLERLARHLGQS